MKVFEQFESEWGQYTNYKNVVGCSSGTAALHLAIEVMQLPLGSRIGVSSLSMIAVPRAVVLAGHVPVPIQCRDDINIDPTSIPKDIDALVVVHTYGRRCDMDGVFANCTKPVIEDLAEAHTILPDQRSFAACWSFYQNKIVAGEEGGAVAFAFAESAKLCRSLRCLGFTDAHDFWHKARGHNYRLSNCHAKLILDSFHNIEWNVDARERLITIYDGMIDNRFKMPKRQSPWVYDVRTPWIESWREQSQLVKQLQTFVPGVRHCFKPVALQPEFVSSDSIVSDNDVARSQQTIYIPLEPARLNETGYVTTVAGCLKLLNRLSDGRCGNDS